MTYKQAIEIIDIEQHGPHDYTLRCRFCGKAKNYETDALVSQLTDMARKHMKCREREEAEDEEPYFKDDEDKCSPMGMQGGVVTMKRRIG